MNTIRLRSRTFAIAFVFLFCCSTFFMYNYFPSGPMPCGVAYLKDLKMKYILKYCNPVKNIAGSEGVFPKIEGVKFKVVSVHAFTRHGDRYHLHAYKNGKRPVISCDVESSEYYKHFTELNSYLEYLKMQTRNEGSTYYKRPTHPQSTICRDGQLTPIGVAQHANIGLIFRSAYMDTEGGHNLFNDENLHEKGMSDEFDLSRLNLEHSFTNSMCLEKYGTPCDCPRLKGRESLMAVSFEEDELNDLTKFHKIAKHVRKVFNIDEDEVPKLTNQLDIAMVHICHKLPLPGDGRGKCLAPWTIHDVYRLLSDNGANSVKVDDIRYRELAILKMLPLLREMNDRIKEQIIGGSTADKQPAFALYSAHDTTIDPLLVALGIGSGLWPWYASRLVIELVQRATGSSHTVYDYFLRVLYNGQVVTNQMLFCEISDAHTQLCPVEQFSYFVDIAFEKFTNGQAHYDACLRDD